MTTASNSTPVFLNNLTLQSSSAINISVVGNFSGQRVQEILVARNSVLELLKVDDYGKLSVVLSHDVFGVIRSLVPFRLTGGSKDYIIVGTDSGKITILEYNPSKNVLDKVHQETFGKSGCRRIVPGQYLAADPKGRAVMIGAVEKQKFVYILNRDTAANLTISSPLEAHKASSIVMDLVAVDVGFDNPIFACIEVDYSEADQDPTGEAYQNREKVLVYYELDLGLNHVVRRWSTPIDLRANKLIAVPGGADGPSGVLVCSEDYITWRHQNHPALRLPIPRRPDPLHNKASDNSVIIVSSVVHKLKRGFFVFAQTELGDIFKITIDYEPNADGRIGISNMKIKYFETLPVTNSMNILKSGFLFAAAEFGNHCLFQILDLGNDEEGQEDFSAIYLPQDQEVSVYFNPRGFRNLNPVDEMDSFAPLIDSKVINISNDDSPQIYTLCGRGSRSSFRILRHGLEVTEIGVSDLPGVPNAVWTVKRTSSEQFDSFIVVSFLNKTLVLSIGETVEEVTDTGFLATTPTLTVAQLGDDALVQVYPQGIRHIRADRRVNEWKAPGNRTIVRASCNQRQVVIALSGGEIVYFELDNRGQLNEYRERREMASAISALAVGPIPAGRIRSKFLAVGCTDNTVRIISLDPDSCLQPMSMQAVNASPEAIVIAEMTDTQTGTISTVVNIGLINGVLLRTALDAVTGTLTDSRLRFLGSRPVKLFPVKVQGLSAVFALSSRPWLNYSYQGRNKLTPLSYHPLEYGSSFSSEQCPEGFVAVVGHTLRIFMVEKLGTLFNQTIIPLKYTPRRFALHAPSKNFIVVESDHKTWCPTDRAKIVSEKANHMDTHSNGSSTHEELAVEHFGLPRGDVGKWASCIRIINPEAVETVGLYLLDENEAAFSVTTCVFHGTPNDTYVIVGTAKDVVPSPRSCSAGFLHTYKVSPDGKSLELIHKTQIEDIPNALCAFQGRLLVGMGKILRIYDVGKKKLLRKCETKGFPNCILTLHTQGNRIVAGDVQESVHYATYRHVDNRIVIFADDSLPRWITATAMADYDTVVGGDKFGQFFMVRLPAETSEEVDDDPSGTRIMYEKGYLGGAAHKVMHLAEFHVGDMITSIHKVSLVAGVRDIVLYTTLLGSIGIFAPFASKDDAEFFSTLEMQMRKELPPLCGRDHLSYRSYFIPVKYCVDGNLVEKYSTLSNDKKAAIANDLDRTIGEVVRKIDDARSRVAF
ncbi:Splicing factor 3B subunit 3 [Nowakowskiella sp. JEL0407]|nr:Splicing factor 3B subunit 3 [Nowakowskiella sp. JEL0407]